MLDSEGTHVIFNEHGSDRRPNPPKTPTLDEGLERGASSSTSGRAPGLAKVETEEKEATGRRTEAGSRGPEEGSVTGQRIGVRSSFRQWGTGSLSGSGPYGGRRCSTSCRTRRSSRAFSRRH